MLAQYVVWFLIATTTSHTSPAVIARFVDKESCQDTAAQMEKQSAGKTSMPSLKAICVSATRNKVYDDGAQ
jgi:hypothetical protein